MYLSYWLDSAVACAVVAGVAQITIAILVVFILILTSFFVLFRDHSCEIDIVVLLEMTAVDLNYRFFLSGWLLLIIFTILSIEELRSCLHVLFSLASHGAFGRVGDFFSLQCKQVLALVTILSDKFSHFIRLI